MSSSSRKSVSAETLADLEPQGLVMSVTAPEGRARDSKA